jgi:hypothetical protein
MSLWAAACGDHDFSRAPGSNDPGSGDAFGAFVLHEVGIRPRLREEVAATPHMRLVCVHLQALLFLVALFTLTTIPMVIVNLTGPIVNGKSSPEVQKNATS